jgi:hypothetical protein
VSLERARERALYAPDFYAQPLDCEVMRVQEHVKLSALAAVAALPWLGKDVLIPLTSSVLIDVDHYMWHAVTNRTLSLREAVQYFGQADPPKRSEARLLHHPLVLGILLLIALRTHSRVLMLILAGLLFHVSLDVVHARQMKSLKQSLTEEANGACPECRKDCETLQLHTVYYSPKVFDHYNPKHFVVLCPTCHERAHS